MAEAAGTYVDGSGDNPTNIPSGISLTSLVPILERCGDAVCVKNGQYHFQSPISDEAWAAVQEFAQTIEELDLSNLGADSQGDTIADITFVQLAIHCRSQLGLLPFLKRLRVNNEGERHNLLFLLLVLSHCLETVEIIGVTPGAGVLVESFLSHSAAQTLTRLAINSSTYLPSPTILHSCTNLQMFEINSAQYSPITPYLQGLVSHPSIEKYEIVAGQDSFKGTPKNLAVRAIQETPQLDVIFSRSTCEVLEVVDVPGLHPASSYLERLSVCHSLQQFDIRTNSDTFTWTPPRFSINIQHGSPYLSMITVWKDVGVLEVEDTVGRHPGTGSKYLNILPLCKNLKEFKIRCRRLQKCCGTLGTSTDNTELTPTSYIDRLFIRTTSLDTFFLPPLEVRHITIEHPIEMTIRVLCHIATVDTDATRIMKFIKDKAAQRIQGLAFTCKKTYFRPRALLSSAWPQLLELKLPINGTRDHLSLKDLKDLAQHCPLLSSLQILVSLPDQPFSPPGGFHSCLLKHPLAHFSTGTVPSDSSVSGCLESEVSAQVARYLCALFPNVEIASHEGFRESAWNAVGEVVQLFQAYQTDFVGQSGQTDGADER